MNSENHILPEELRNNAGGRANGFVVDFAPPQQGEAGWSAAAVGVE